MEIHRFMLKLCLRDLEWKLLFVATDCPGGYEEGKSIVSCAFQTLVLCRLS